MDLLLNFALDDSLQVLLELLDESHDRVTVMRDELLLVSLRILVPVGQMILDSDELHVQIRIGKNGRDTDVVNVYSFTQLVLLLLLIFILFECNIFFGEVIIVVHVLSLLRDDEKSVKLKLEVLVALFLFVFTSLNLIYFGNVQRPESRAV